MQVFEHLDKKKKTYIDEIWFQNSKHSKLDNLEWDYRTMSKKQNEFVVCNALSESSQ